LLGFIWSVIIAAAFVYSFSVGQTENLVSLLNSAISDAANLFLTLAPLMCFWSGIMEITEQSGITGRIARILSPVTRFLFPEIRDDKSAMHKICMNISANILGMGNAATPLGLSAMERLDEINPEPSRASRAMCMFAVINTASVQLIPSSVITLRAAFGSESPSDIIPSVWITTAVTFCVGVFAAKLCGRRA